MKVFDAHIHGHDTVPAPEDLLRKMDLAGVYGGCIFSNRPTEYNTVYGTGFDDRLREVLDWCKGYEDRLFPVLWIHPHEKDALSRVHIAADNGIAAFKIICKHFYVYDAECMELIREIACVGKPIFFHSGILWDSFSIEVGSIYNRPLNWEYLLKVPGLRFSMGHCAWPWYDECLALFSEFEAAKRVGPTAEMYLDITPGAPEMDRRDMFAKLFKRPGAADYVFFGSDQGAESYDTERVQGMITFNNSIYDEIGLNQTARQKLYGDNLLRFLGK